MYTNMYTYTYMYVHMHMYMYMFICLYIYVIAGMPDFLASCQSGTRKEKKTNDTGACPAPD